MHTDHPSHYFVFNHCKTLCFLCTTWGGNRTFSMYMRAHSRKRLSHVTVLDPLIEI